MCLIIIIIIMASCPPSSAAAKPQIRLNEEGDDILFVDGHNRGRTLQGIMDENTQNRQVIAQLQSAIEQLQAALAEMQANLTLLANMNNQLVSNISSLQRAIDAATPISAFRSASLVPSLALAASDAQFLMNDMSLADRNWPSPIFMLAGTGYRLPQFSDEFFINPPSTGCYLLGDNPCDPVGNVTLMLPGSSIIPNGHLVVLNITTIPSHTTSLGPRDWNYAVCSTNSTVLWVRFMAKAPVGTSFHTAGNCGNCKRVWLTSPEGTGKWDYYVYTIPCNHPGVDAILVVNVLPTNTPFVVYLASYAVYAH